MFPAERLKHIKEILEEKKQIDISFLSSALKVTEVTIRRDLEKLEAEGFLVRTHGGAVLDESNIPATLGILQEPSPELVNDITILGTISGFFVNDNDVIFLGPGISNRYFQNAIKGKKNLTVVTNDLLIAVNLAIKTPETRIICPSGVLNTGDFQLYGRIGDDVLKNLNYNVAFIDVDGVSIEKGYTVSSLDKSYLIKDIIKYSDKVIAVCVHSRFNQNSFVPLGKLDFFQTVISNEKMPTQFKEYYFNNNIQLYCTFDAYQG